jgi:hypothetical protein
MYQINAVFGLTIINIPETITMRKVRPIPIPSPWHLDGAKNVSMLEEIMNTVYPPSVKKFHLSMKYVYIFLQGTGFMTLYNIIKGTKNR